MLKHTLQAVFGHGLTVFLTTMALTAHGAPVNAFEFELEELPNPPVSLLCPINYVQIGTRCVKGLQNPECAIGSYWDGQQCAVDELDPELPEPIVLPRIW